jgi:hypothetical protein
MWLTDEDWDELLYAIKDNKCTPFIGTIAFSLWLPLGSEIARDWAGILIFCSVCCNGLIHESISIV